MLECFFWIYTAQPGHLAHPALIEGEKAARAVESFVVEADRQEGRQPVHDCSQIAVDATKGVHRRYPESRLNRVKVSPDVGLLLTFDHAIAIQVRQAPDASRPMVLEATPQDANPIRPKRRTEGVTHKASELAFLELELDC